MGTGVEQGLGAGFGLGAGVAADDGGGRRGEAELWHEGVGEAGVFVGYDALANAACVQVGDERGGLREEDGVAPRAALVFGQVLLPQGFVFGV